MRRRIVLRRLAIAALGAAMVAPLGCAGGNNPTPPPDVARSALERSLTAWRDGAPSGPIAGGEPAVQAVDSSWAAGRKLESFEILREEPGEGDRRFDVRLTLRDPAATDEVEYVVLGRGPVWVYRQDDYARMINMDDNPGPEKPRRKARR